MTAPAIENPGSNHGVAMMPQPHGGALKRGGRNPNSGRRPSAIRRQALKMLASRLHLVGAIADGVTVEFEENGATKLVSPKPSDRLNALKLLAEMGLGGKVDVTEVRQCLSAQVALIQSRETWTRGELLAALAEVWGG